MTITIYGNAPSKKSSQIFIPRLKRLIPNKKYTDYKKDFGRQLTAKDRNQFNPDDKLKIHIAWFCKDRITVRDIVNMEQSIWDCLQDFGVIDDDSRFYLCSASKSLDKENPRVEINIQKIEEAK